MKSKLGLSLLMFSAMIIIMSSVAQASLPMIEARGVPFPCTAVHYDAAGATIRTIVFDSNGNYTVTEDPMQENILPAYIDIYNSNGILTATNYYNSSGQLLKWKSYTYYYGGKYAVCTLYDSADATIYTDTYYYNQYGVSLYSMRVYSNGEIEYRNANGQLFTESLLDKNSISRDEYADMVNWDIQVGGGGRLTLISYDDFISAVYNQETKNYLRSAIDRGMALDSASMTESLSRVQHLIFSLYDPNARGIGFYCPSTNTVLINSSIFTMQFPSGDVVDQILILFAHEAVHIRDLHGISSPTHEDFWRSESNAYSENARWMELLGFSNDQINLNKFIADHIPDDNYGGIIFQALNNPGNPALADQAFFPAGCAQMYLETVEGLTDIRYVSSPLSTMQRDGATVTVYAFTFTQNNGPNVTIFADKANGQWVNYNNAWHFVPLQPPQQQSLNDPPQSEAVQPSTDPISGWQQQVLNESLAKQTVVKESHGQALGNKGRKHMSYDELASYDKDNVLPLRWK